MYWDTIHLTRCSCKTVANSTNPPVRVSFRLTHLQWCWIWTSIWQDCSIWQKISGSVIHNSTDPPVRMSFPPGLPQGWLSVYLQAHTYSRLSNRRRLWNKGSLNFHITILIHFYINLGIAVIFWFFFHQQFKKKSDL